MELSNSLSPSFLRKIQNIESESFLCVWGLLQEVHQGNFFHSSEMNYPFFSQDNFSIANECTSSCWLELILVWQSPSMLLLTSDQWKYKQGQALAGVLLWTNESMSALWMDEVSQHCSIVILCQLYHAFLLSFCFTKIYSSIFFLT